MADCDDIRTTAVARLSHGDSRPIITTLWNRTIAGAVRLRCAARCKRSRSSLRPGARAHFVFAKASLTRSPPRIRLAASRSFRNYSPRLRATRRTGRPVVGDEPAGDACKIHILKKNFVPPKRRFNFFFLYPMQNVLFFYFHTPPSRQKSRRKYDYRAQKTFTAVSVVGYTVRRGVKWRGTLTAKSRWIFRYFCFPRERFRRFVRNEL